MMISSSRALRATVAAVLIALAALSNIDLAAAATEPVTGTATTSGGDGSTTSDFTYTSTGLLGSGTIHTDFTLNFGTNPITAVGSGVITRSDGATLTATDTGTVDLQSFPYAVEIHLVVTSGTGALAGVTGEVVLTGFSRGPGAVGDPFTMSGSLTTNASIPTAKAQCKHGGWRDVADDQAEPFKNEGLCVAFVRAA